MKISNFLFFCLFVIILNSAFGCAQKIQPKGIKIVATFSVLADLVQNVGGNRISLDVLVGPDSDAHTFEPSPEDSVKLNKAVVVFENGVDFEVWLDKLFASSKSKANRIVVSKGLILRDGLHKHSKEEDNKHHENESDPHIWHDVENVIHIVKMINTELKRVDPDGSAEFDSNTENFLIKLNQLNNWIKSETDVLTKNKKKLITNHDTFGYYADRYGFEIPANALSSFSTESSEPSAKQFADLILTIKTSKVPSIFVENVHNAKIMEKLARECKVKLAPPLYTDALGKKSSEGDTYEKMMRYNTKTIIEALTNE